MKETQLRKGLTDELLGPVGVHELYDLMKNSMVNLGTEDFSFVTTMAIKQLYGNLTQEEMLRINQLRKSVGLP